MVGRPLDRLRTGIAHLRIVLQAPDDIHREIVAHLNLAGKAEIFWALAQTRQSRLLGLGHLAGIAVDDLDAAGGAPRITAAPVQDIDAGIHNAEHQSLPFLDLGFPDANHRYLRHDFPVLCKRPPQMARAAGRERPLCESRYA
jgi:hypothetical protein